MKKLIALFLSLMLLFAVALPVVAETTEATEQEIAVVEKDGIQYILVGEGETSFIFTATDGEGNTLCFIVSTNETTVGAALVALEMISGEESQYGLYVKNVLGTVADYNVDGTYWAFYINGEYAMTGVDSTPIEEGAIYSMVVSK